MFEFCNQALRIGMLEAHEYRIERISYARNEALLGIAQRHGMILLPIGSVIQLRSAGLPSRRSATPAGAAGSSPPPLMVFPSKYPAIVPKRPMTGAICCSV